MSKRILYVGGLSRDVCDARLRELFLLYGGVTRAWVIRHKTSGRSAGYGFVEMQSGAEALQAVLALEGACVDGACLRLYVTPHASSTVS